MLEWEQTTPGVAPGSTHFNPNGKSRLYRIQPGRIAAPRKKFEPDRRRPGKEST